MANLNATRQGEIAQKKMQGALVINLNDQFYADVGQTTNVTQNFLIAELPADAVITNAYIDVRTVSDAATSATVQLGTAEAGAQIMAATTIKTAAVAGSLVGKLSTGTGQKVYMRVVLSGATTTLGNTYVVLEYTEYNKNTGEYTRFLADD